MRSRYLAAFRAKFQKVSLVAQSFAKKRAPPFPEVPRGIAGCAGLGESQPALACRASRRNCGKELDTRRQTLPRSWLRDRATLAKPAAHRQAARQTGKWYGPRGGIAGSGWCGWW